MPAFRITNAFLRWAVYGYVLGLLGWFALMLVFLVNAAGMTAGNPQWESVPWHYGFMWAIPWAVANGLCGLISRTTGAIVTAAAASVGVVIGIVLEFRDCSWVDGWLAITIPVYSIPGMLGAAVVMWIVWGGRKPLGT